MITQQVTQSQLARWKELWQAYRGRLRPNRKTGQQLLDDLRSRYVLTEWQDRKALEAISGNVLENEYWAEKLPPGRQPRPRAFFLENAGEGRTFYLPENRDPEEVWGGEIHRIFVGIDLASGFYMVEGSTLLWDRLCAFQGLDQQDLENYVQTGQYIECLKRFGLLERVLER